MSITLNSDFVGEYKIPTNTYTNLQSYIDKYEREILLQLLGITLYDEFIAQLTAGFPTEQRFLDVFYEYAFDLNGTEFIGIGIKNILVCFIYFHYMREIVVSKTLSGAAVMDSELQTNILYNFNLKKVYNEGVENARKLQCYLSGTEWIPTAQFDTYNGKNFNYIYL